MSPIDTIIDLDADAIAREIGSDILNWTDRISTLTICVDLPKGCKPRARYFPIPDAIDELVAFLFDMSLTSKIDHCFRTVMASNRKVLTGYYLYLAPASNGQTNISPDLMETLMGFK